MITPIPVVKLTDQAHALGVRCPHGKARSSDAIDRPQLRAELLIHPTIIAFVEQVKIRFAQGREKGIAIAVPPRVALIVRDHQIIRVNFAGTLRDTLEDSAVVDSLLLADRDHLHLRGVMKISAHHHAAAVAERVHAEQLVRVTVLSLGQAFQLWLRENHAGPMLPRRRADGQQKTNRHDLRAQTQVRQTNPSAAQNVTRHGPQPPQALLQSSSCPAKRFGI